MKGDAGARSQDRVARREGPAPRRGQEQFRVASALAREGGDDALETVGPAPGTADFAACTSPLAAVGVLGSMRLRAPIALDAVVHSASGQMLRQRGVFTHRFIAAHAVPAHFFDPAAIGYVPPENQLNHVPRGFTVYWLGTHVAGVRGLPPLLLTKVDPGGAARGGYLFILTYSRTDDRFGAGGVTLIEWPLGVVGNSPWPYGPCWAHRDITTPRARARIFLGFENAPPPGSKSCPAPPYNRFMARVYLGQTMVTVDAPEARAGSLRITNPYNTRKGIEMVVRALRPRVPTHGATGSNR